MQQEIYVWPEQDVPEAAAAFQPFYGTTAAERSEFREYTARRSAAIERYAHYQLTPRVGYYYAIFYLREVARISDEIRAIEAAQEHAIEQAVEVAEFSDDYDPCSRSGHVEYACVKKQVAHSIKKRFAKLLRAALTQREELYAEALAREAAH